VRAASGYFALFAFDYLVSVSIYFQAGYNIRGPDTSTSLSPGLPTVSTGQSQDKKIKPGHTKAHHRVRFG
jgi:hypothetical protein